MYDIQYISSPAIEYIYLSLSVESAPIESSFVHFFIGDPDYNNRQQWIRRNVRLLAAAARAASGLILWFWPLALPLSKMMLTGSTPSLSSSPSSGSPRSEAGSPRPRPSLPTSSISSSLTKYYHVIKALSESSIERIPELLIPPADDPYSVLKDRLMELYDLSNYERAELLMALPQVDGDMRPSLLTTLPALSGMPSSRDCRQISA